MNALDEAIKRSSDISEMVRSEAIYSKDVGAEGMLAPVGEAMEGFAGFGDRQGQYKHRYSLFKGWLFSAINAIASKAAGQNVNVAKFTNDIGEERGKLATRKREQLNILMRKMTENAHSRCQKAPNLEVEILRSNPLVDALEKPNEIQDRWQFVYSFVANLAITGWSYIIIDTNDEGKLQFFSIPTTWVTPLSSGGKPFEKFQIRNPRKPGSEGKILDKDHVAFAYLPNPSDPLTALSPSSAQIEAIKIDDHIQSSQEAFFNNGIFPSVKVIVGRNPHPEVTAGVRPRLTSAQRRQVHGVLNRTVRGVLKYGNPAIVDGYIEDISRLSATQNEMGWEKSEDKVRSRILSAFCVHPYILGEPVGVGGYAQVAGIEKIFCERVNTYLNMLGNVISNKVINISQDEKLLIWWDKCEPLDPNIRNSMLKEGRKNGDVTRNEFRAELGLAPMEERSDRSKLLENPVVFSSMFNALGKVSAGELDGKIVAQLLVLFLRIPEEEANRVVGVGSDENVQQEVLEELRNAVRAMKEPIQLEIKEDSVNDFLRLENEDEDDSNLVPA